MKRSPFRSLDEWKAALLTLPDDPYSELFRNLLGNIKTPFSKQGLLEEVVHFLSQETIQQTIAAYIDEMDHKILAGVALLAEPTVQELWQFLDGELSFLEFQELLINLEERFILYRFSQEGSRHLALNPLLEPILRPFLADTSLLFPSMPWEGDLSGSSGRPRVDDRILASVVAVVLEEDYGRADRGVRKKVLHTLDRLFPGLKAPFLIDAFQGLGLFHRSAEGGRLYPDEGRFRAFQKPSSWERLVYCAAGFCCFRWCQGQEVSGTLQGQVRTYAGFIYWFLGLLEPSRQYPRVSLQRFGHLLIREGIEPIRSRDSSYRFDLLLEALELLGLLEPAAPGCWRLVPEPVTSKAEGPVLAMDRPFSCVLYPEITFEDALSMAFFSVPRNHGAGTGQVVLRFELTKSSVIRGFDQGMDAQTMLDLLNRLSGNRLDQSLMWALQDWEQRYTEVSLHKGVVLTLAEERRYLAETGPVASLITQILGPGVYLLSVSKRSEAVEALQKVGVDSIAQHEGPQKCASSTGQAADTGEFQGYPALEHVPFPTWIPGRQAPEDQEIRAAARTAIKARFHRALQELPLSGVEAVQARIERRVILDASQLVGTAIRSEKLEAQGRDYVGKASIAKQAIATLSLLEVWWLHPEGGSTCTVGIPEALKKWGGESVLLLKPLFQDESAESSTQKQRLSPEAGSGKAKAPQETIRLPLGKISRVRRIKPSFFGE